MSRFTATAAYSDETTGLSPGLRLLGRLFSTSRRGAAVVVARGIVELAQESRRQ